MRTKPTINYPSQSLYGQAVALGRPRRRIRLLKDAISFVTSKPFAVAGGLSALFGLAVGVISKKASTLLPIFGSAAIGLFTCQLFVTGNSTKKDITSPEDSVERAILPLRCKNDRRFRFALL